MEGSELHDAEQSPLLDDSSLSSSSSDSGRKDALTISTSTTTNNNNNNNFPLSPTNSDRSYDDRRFSSLLQSPSYESPAAFENYEFEFLIRWYRRVWCIVLGFAGVLDILAYLEPVLRSLHREQCSTIIPQIEAELQQLPTLLLGGGDEFQLLLAQQQQQQQPWYCSTWITFLDRLHNYNVVIAFSFSWLWFMQSHSKAREAYYYKFSVKEDRLQLSEKDDDDNHERNKGWTPKKLRKYNATRAFYRRMLSRMLLLPVGFYVITFRLLQGLTNGQWLYRQLLIRAANETETVFTTINDPGDKYINIEITETQAKMSTVFAIFLYFKYHFLLYTSLARTEFLKSTHSKLRRKLVGDAVRNPRNFIRKLKKVMRYVRWVKYIIPMVAKLNKLRANTMATIRKSRQYRISRKMKRTQSLVRMSLLKKLSREEREANAATLIQHVWRSHQKHKLRRVAVCFVKDKRVSAAMKIQIASRRMALQAKIEKSRKMRELFRLEQLKRHASKQLDEEDRRRLYQLQDEFMTEAKKTINKRLLVRPNTRLAVLWNSIFVFCVLVEMSHTALRPWLIIPKAKRVNGQKYRSQRLFLAEYFTPAPVAETEACRDVFRKKPALQRLFFHSRHKEQPTRQEVLEAFVDEIIDPDFDLDGLGGLHNNYTNHTVKEKIKWRCREPISTWRDGFRDLVALTFRPDPVSEWPACQPKEISLVEKLNPFRNKKAPPPPWYCTKPYSVIHDAYRKTWNFVIDQVLGIISVICFLDVFVKFFTGEVDPITGELKPKPFLRRWIFPGLLLQLLVNPAIGNFSALFFAITNWIQLVGPIRVVRWCIAVVVPMLYGTRNLVLHTLQEAESDKQLARYRMQLWEYST